MKYWRFLITVGPPGVCSVFGALCALLKIIPVAVNFNPCVCFCEKSPPSGSHVLSVFNQEEVQTNIPDPQWLQTVTNTENTQRGVRAAERHAVC